MPKSKDRGTGTQMKTLKFLDKHLEEFIMVLLLSSIVVIMLFYKSFADIFSTIP